MECSLSGSPVLGDSLGKNIGMGFHALLRGSSQPRDGVCASSSSYIGSQVPYLCHYLESPSLEIQS